MSKNDEMNDLEHELAVLRPQPGDVLVLCSDGLTEHVKKREVAALVEDPDPDEVARGLIDVANQRGGHDNITVVVARAV